MPVSPARPELSPGISQTTRHTTYELFTPSKSGQRLHPTYYRGCWHVVSRCFFSTVPSPTRWASSRAKGVYNPKAFIPHAASLHQACAHCAIFPTAASRRSLGRVSVPMWPSTLSGRLPVAALVGHYPTNKLIGRGLIPHRTRLSTMTPTPWSYVVLDPVSQAYPTVRGRSPTCYSPVRHSSTHHQKVVGLSVRLACVKHAASVRPEPGSNSPTTTHHAHTAQKCVLCTKQNKIKDSVSSVYLLTRATHPTTTGGVCDTHTTTLVVCGCV